MVTDNDNWIYCSSILRRKGRKRWTDGMETRDRYARWPLWSPSRRETFARTSLPHSRLLNAKEQRPGSCSFRYFLSQISSFFTFKFSFIHFFILFLVISCTKLPSVSCTTEDYKQDVYDGDICTSIDIRNTVDSFKQLIDCSVIEGFLQIVLMDRTNESHFTNLTFPKLREITGYLLLYRVNGLKSLANLFPNLSVIRGQDLFINYALAIYEMLHLQELGLHSLTDIARGYVFITKNPLLCYTDTIDWSRILNSNATMDSNSILENRQSNACPKCPTFNDRLCAYNNQTKQSLCWNSQHCQRTCPDCDQKKCSKEGQCCDDNCLGGCSDNRRNDCFACQKVVWQKQCIEKCPSGYFEFKDRRCITEDECNAMVRSKEDVMDQQIRVRPYKAHMGKCIIECPHGHGEESFTNSAGLIQYRCKKCEGQCRKMCDAANVDSIQSAQRLKGCVIINGSLEIQIRGGANIVKELEENLNMIEEITGYLKIVRSLSLVSLNFMRKLKHIRGDILENGKYVLVVLDNQNLAELWDFSRRESELSIGRGRIFFHFNPRLCLHKIIELQKKLNITRVDELEVATNSNGDKVACNITMLHVFVEVIKHDYVILTWIPYSHYEMRTLLGYVIYFMETPANVIVSMNDGRDGCGGDGWSTIDVEVSDTASNSAPVNVSWPIPHLKPYTRYAYYVKTYTIATETNGAQSPIQYFRTNPSTPTPPRQLKITSLSSSEVRIQWQPPEQPNGNIIRYIVSGDYTDGQKLLDQRNYCEEPLDAEKKDNSREEMLKRTSTPAPEKKLDECACNVPEVQPKIKKNDQEVQALIEFENKLHDTIYVKTSHSSNIGSGRIRRDIMHHSKNMLETKGITFKNMFFSNEVNGSSLKEILKGKIAEPKNYTSSDHFKYEVSNSTLQLTVGNLKHFSEYSISVIACRERIPSEGRSFPPECSTGKMENIQTLPLEDADRIDPSTINIEVLNDTKGVLLSWAKPEKTNGQILTYLIQYRSVEVENQQAQTQCVTNHDFEEAGGKYVLKNLHSGNFSVIIRATSLTKDLNNNFSPPRYFYIEESKASIIKQLVLGAAIGVGILVLVLVIVLITIRLAFPECWHSRKLLLATVNPEYFKPVEGYDKWEVKRSKIVFGPLLGLGHFGEVYEGRVKGIITKGVTTKVAIKTLNKTTNYKTWNYFLNEASVMKQFDTHHVVRLLGVVTRGQPLVIMELMVRGDLRTYLRNCRPEIPEEERNGPLQPPPTLLEILQMAAEIADGMLYLSHKKFVHRDLAARNCMLNTEGTVKIGDFGLTRDVYETDYYRKDSKGHLPVRWMAPESLRDGIFTSRSDMWSYGVVLWEMVTLASLPYTGLGNGEVMPYVINGGVMDIPENCPVILADIMKSCWQFKYKSRPTFSEIIVILLPYIRDDFATVSYYHTEEARTFREKNANAATEEDTDYTPLRILEDIEDFTLDSDDDEEKELNPDADHEANPSSANASVHSLPTVNGYIRRPHNVVTVEPAEETKTTLC